MVSDIEINHGLEGRIESFGCAESRGDYIERDHDLERRNEPIGSAEMRERFDIGEDHWSRREKLCRIQTLSKTTVSTAEASRLATQN